MLLSEMTLTPNLTLVTVTKRYLMLKINKIIIKHEWNCILILTLNLLNSLKME